jgi:hypothetical protein
MKENVVALDFETLRFGGCEERFEESKGLEAVFGENVKLQEGVLGLPRACNRDGTEADDFVLGL